MKTEPKSLQGTKIRSETWLLWLSIRGFSSRGIKKQPLCNWESLTRSLRILQWAHSIWSAESMVGRVSECRLIQKTALITGARKWAFLFFWHMGHCLYWILHTAANNLFTKQFYILLYSIVQLLHVILLKFILQHIIFWQVPFLASCIDLIMQKI